MISALLALRPGIYYGAEFVVDHRNGNVKQNASGKIGKTCPQEIASCVWHKYEPHCTTGCPEQTRGRTKDAALCSLGGVHLKP